MLDIQSEQRLIPFFDFFRQIKSDLTYKSKQSDKINGKSTKNTANLHGFTTKARGILLAQFLILFIG